MTGEFARAKKFVEDYHRYTLTRLQNPDGSFSTEWFRAPGARPDLNRRIQTTGHILEWLAYSLPFDALEDPRVVQAVEYLTGVLEEKRDGEIGPLGHAVHSLAIYDARVFKPRDDGSAPPPLVADSHAVPVKPGVSEPVPTAAANPPRTATRWNHSHRGNNEGSKNNPGNNGSSKTGNSGLHNSSTSNNGLPSNGASSDGLPNRGNSSSGASSNAASNNGSSNGLPNKGTAGNNNNNGIFDQAFGNKSSTGTGTNSNNSKSGTPNNGTAQGSTSKNTTSSNRPTPPAPPPASSRRTAQP